MKAYYGIKGKIGLCIFLVGTMMSCINQVAGERENAIDNENFPLKFIANIEKNTKARIVNNTFSEGDCVGLFAMTGTTTMKEVRYIDNLQFRYSVNGIFESEELVYYPNDGTTFNLISYYPYQKEGVATGESTMKVAVLPKQNEVDNYSYSDFIVAYKENVSKTNETISMTYKHKFFKLKITIVPKKEGELDAFFNANPQISIIGLYTKADYDFQQKSFNNFSNDESITFAGEWKQVGNELTGKEAILIPQEVVKGNQYITFKIDDKEYFSLLPEALLLQSGIERELEIAFEKEKDELISNIRGEISDWEGGEIDQSTSETMHSYIDISKLTFELSNVHKILHNGKKVAEICKELIVTPDKVFQAIVAYPMKDDIHTDLSKGIVMQVLGQSGKVHGGTVAWNVENSSLVYTPGDLDVVRLLYVLKDGQLALKKTIQDETLLVIATNDIVRDSRGQSIHNYPLVKIGTQYWMRDNLAESIYMDGTEIVQLDTMSLDANGYILSKAGNYYYSQKSVLSNNLIPVGYKIPNWNDWNILKEYLAGNVSYLKTGTWVPIKGNGVELEVKEANNLSNFNAAPIGLCWKTILPSEYEGKYLSYWTMNELGSAMDTNTFFLRSNTNEIHQSETSSDKAYAIRCIRK